jgi:hypothetical protein
MDITVYLPDDIGQWAKNNELNLSAMLRAAVIEERDQRKAMAETLGDSAVHELTVEDGEGGYYTVRLHGAQIAEAHGGPGGDRYVYLTEDERLIVYSESRSRLYEDIDVSDLREWIDDDGDYIAAMRALGQNAVIDIGRAS